MVDGDTIKKICAAIREKNLPEFEKLINVDKARMPAGAMFGSWLHVAAQQGCLEIVQALTEQGSDINLTNDAEKNPPILMAVNRGRVEVVKYLLSKGAKLDVTLPENNPLFAAIDGGYPDIAKILIDHGIDTRVKYRGTSGKIKDALSYARDWGRAEIAEMIEQAKS